jgi:hypothetical protein
LKLNPVFENIDEEAEEHGNKFSIAPVDGYPESIDPADYAEEAMDCAFKHWEFLNLMVDTFF